MAKILDFVAYRKKRGRERRTSPRKMEENSIVILMLGNGDLAWYLNGVFKASRRFTAQSMTRVLSEVLDD
ncbi:hypothetical protein [Cupriavidus sp. D39]|uniref:hypothetical protein n=1 Tax=Cupriavidus sp. D39 TaxID=2997877 RepID=UPI002271C848|nr:hypothetical protein [Cupriavidus sp. D39]MCY0854298.1 hypothetical protein [Cupriavidus sp. D39]